MMLIIGKGGEGKSRIGLVLRELFGNNMYSCSLQKIEVDKFARANLEYMLITVDDDMKLEALPQTNHIKVSLHWRIRLIWSVKASRAFRVWYMPG